MANARIHTQMRSFVISKDEARELQKKVATTGGELRLHWTPGECIFKAIPGIGNDVIATEYSYAISEKDLQKADPELWHKT